MNSAPKPRPMIATLIFSLFMEAQFSGSFATITPQNTRFLLRGIEASATANDTDLCQNCQRKSWRENPRRTRAAEMRSKRRVDPTSARFCLIGDDARGALE